MSDRCGTEMPADEEICSGDATLIVRFITDDYCMLGRAGKNG
jgi:hypothetical protein